MMNDGQRRYLPFFASRFRALAAHRRVVGGYTIVTATIFAGIQAWVAQADSSLSTGLGSLSMGHLAVLLAASQAAFTCLVVAFPRGDEEASAMVAELVEQDDLRRTERDVMFAAGSATTEALIALEGLVSRDAEQASDSQFKNDIDLLMSPFVSANRITKLLGLEDDDLWSADLYRYDGGPDELVAIWRSTHDQHPRRNQLGRTWRRSDDCIVAYSFVKCEQVVEPSIASRFTLASGEENMYASGVALPVALPTDGTVGGAKPWGVFVVTCGIEGRFADIVAPLQGGADTVLECIQSLLSVYIQYRLEDEAYTEQ